MSPWFSVIFIFFFSLSYFLEVEMTNKFVSPESLQAIDVDFTSWKMLISRERVTFNILILLETRQNVEFTWSRNVDFASRETFLTEGIDFHVFLH